jgi:hypothetical protein
LARNYFVAAVQVSEPVPAPLPLEAAQLPDGSVMPMAGGVKAFLAGKSDAQRQRIFTQALGLDGAPPGPRPRP